jgi:hypothetical protein
MVASNDTPQIKVIQNKSSITKIIEGDIFYILYKENVLVEVSDFQEAIASYHTLSQGSKLKFLVEFPEFVSFTPEARVWAEENQVDLQAEAVVFKSLAQRIVIRFYSIFRKQHHPIKIFTSHEKALHWLKSI